MEFEKEVEKIIDEYGAPEIITDGIKDFLLDSLNVYTILEAYKNCKSCEIELGNINDLKSTK